MGIIKKNDEQIIENEDKGLFASSYYTKQTQNDVQDTQDDDLDALLNDEDENVFSAYRQKRLLDLQAQLERKKFGEVGEITKQDYLEQVNNAGENIWVVLHVYKPG